MFVFLAEKHNKWFLGMWLNDKVPLYGGNFDEMSKKSKRQKKIILKFDQIIIVCILISYWTLSALNKKLIATEW